MKTFIIGLTCLVIASFTPWKAVQADEEAPALFVDPPVFISNLSTQPVNLVWQTLLPDRALSPQRGAGADADSKDVRADTGFLLFVDRNREETLRNIIFVSILGSDGSIVAQSRLEIGADTDIDQVHKGGLAVVVQKDGSLSLSKKQ